MSGNLYLVHFNYDGFVTPVAKPLYEQAYNLMRGVAVDRINPMLEEWNNAYGKVQDLDDYNHYIQKKQQKILDQVNLEFNTSPVKLYATDECEIVGKFTEVLTKKLITMFITLTPYKK